MSKTALLAKLETQPAEVEFQEVITVIDEHFDFTPVQFTNGDLTNEANTNNGSCKILAFGQLEGLSKEQTLQCFGRYYRDDVLGEPNGTSHGNIRNFMVTGWAGVRFAALPLTEKD
jgi:hypothetical protein